MAPLLNLVPATSGEAAGVGVVSPTTVRVLGWLSGLGPGSLSSLNVTFSHPRVYVSVHDWAAADVAGAVEALGVRSARLRVNWYPEGSPAPYVSLVYGASYKDLIEVMAFVRVRDRAEAEQVLADFPGTVTLPATASAVLS